MKLQNIHWHLAYELSYRRTVGPFMEETMLGRGFDVGHSTIHRWVIHNSPKQEQNLRVEKRRPSDGWRLEETYVRIKGKWNYYYRAVDRHGETVGFFVDGKTQY